MDVIRSEKKFYDEINNQFADSTSHNGTMLLETGEVDRYGTQSSYFAHEPDLIVRSSGNSTVVTIGNTEEVLTGNPWDLLKDIRRKYPGWYFGYLGYDLKNHTEKLVSTNSDLMRSPDLLFFRAGRVVRLMHDNECLSPQYWNYYRDSLHAERYELGPVSFRTRKSDYISKIHDIQTFIKEGLCYEINLSQTLTAPFSGDPYQLYRHMTTQNRVPFSAFFSMGDISICSTSPERFIGKSGSHLFSQPIKGTAAKDPDPVRDQQLIDQLINSEKEQAENLMIVDLVRHDLSKVCLPGSVHVPSLFQLQSFETVHQLISTVEGTLNTTIDVIDAIRHCFPMGSMTGAPKIISMEIIDQLEDYKRGIYSGAIGYISPDDNFDFSVIIRSAIVSDSEIFYPAGGAITSGSIPENEWIETIVKSKALPGFDFNKALEIDN